jgi:cytochrome c biogenesis factor
MPFFAVSGVFILLSLCIFIGGSLTLYAWRASRSSRAACSRRFHARARSVGMCDRG